MCNEKIIKHMEEDMTFRGLSERTQKSYIWRVSRYMDFHKGKDIEKLTTPENKEAVEKYIQTMNTLRETEIDIPLDKFKASVIFNKGIAAEQLIHLYPIIEED